MSRLSLREQSKKPMPRDSLERMHVDQDMTLMSMLLLEQELTSVVKRLDLLNHLKESQVAQD